MRGASLSPCAEAWAVVCEGRVLLASPLFSSIYADTLPPAARQAEDAPLCRSPYPHRAVIRHFTLDGEEHEIYLLRFGEESDGNLPDGSANRFSAVLQHTHLPSRPAPLAISPFLHEVCAAAKERLSLSVDIRADGAGARLAEVGTAPFACALGLVLGYFATVAATPSISLSFGGRTFSLTVGRVAPPPPFLGRLLSALAAQGHFICEVRQGEFFFRLPSCRAPAVPLRDGDGTRLLHALCDGASLFF